MSPFIKQLSLFCVIFLTIKTTSSDLQSNCKTIDAAFTVQDSGDIYFFSGNEYIEYSSYYESEAKNGPIGRLGLEPVLENIEAAFMLNNGSVYFFKDCEYYRYNASDRRRFRLSLDHQGSMADLGLPCNVDAAVSWVGQTLVFKGCETWSLNTSTDRFDLEGPISDRGLPCDLDAAMAWGYSSAVFVKGTTLWRFEDSMQGPFHTDLLNLCSWYLCGEADWMEGRRRGGTLKCNGDERLCPLRLNQVTWAGLHNAGAGFSGGFGLLDCWLRNHEQTITRQLELGIRHLDIDPCFQKCGLLGTCHSFSCGGSICKIIKQVRGFLKDHRDEVVTINFNHEIYEPRIIFRELNQVLKIQLGPMLNSKFRLSGERRWPTLQRAVRSNERVFIIYGWVIEDNPYDRYYRRFKWIHSESLYGSTWRPFPVGNDCGEVVALTGERCQVRQYKELVEVSMIPESGACISAMAEMCKVHYHSSLRACEPYRFQHNDSPNVILVDYPEVGTEEVTSVFHAVFHQNVRNIYRHRSRSCKVKVNAAVNVPGNDTTLFFVGKQMIVYSHTKRAQIHARAIQDLQDIDAAYMEHDHNRIHIIKGCQTWSIDATTLERLPDGSSQMSLCDVDTDAAVIWNSQLYFFQGCNVNPQGLEPIPLADWGLPCHVDAVMEFGGQLFIFKDNNYWKYAGQGVASLEGRVLDWTIDAVQCQ